MRLFNPVDLVLTILESRVQPMNVGGLYLFEVPVDKATGQADTAFIQKLAKQFLNSKMPPSYPFNQVVEHFMFWQKDEGFELFQHFRHIALPQPATVRELLHYISLEHSRLMNKSKPLWECHIIEGIAPEVEGGLPRFALYLKFHHSLLDGIAGMRLTKKMFSESPTEISHLPIWSTITRHRSKLDEILPIDKPVKTIIKEQLSSIKPVFNELTHSITELTNPNFISTLQAPRSILNQRITASRRISVESYKFSRFQKLATEFAVSSNDIVLAVCAGALRNYLLENNALPKKPLIAFVPISLRAKDDGSIAGNQVSFLLANLATHLKDPKKRIKTISGSMNNGKKRFGRMSQAEVINYSAITYSWAGLNLFAGLFPKIQAFNLIISNVTGTRKPLYWNGAELKAVYPASVLLSGQAMNITLTNYDDMMDFCITACDDVLPHSQRVLELIADELDALERLIA